MAHPKNQAIQPSTLDHCLGSVGSQYSQRFHQNWLQDGQQVQDPMSPAHAPASGGPPTQTTACQSLPAANPAFPRPASTVCNGNFSYGTHVNSVLPSSTPSEESQHSAPQPMVTGDYAPATTTPTMVSEIGFAVPRHAVPGQEQRVATSSPVSRPPSTLMQPTNTGAATIPQTQVSRDAARPAVATSMSQPPATPVETSQPMPLPPCHTAWFTPEAYRQALSSFESSRVFSRMNKVEANRFSHLKTAVARNDWQYLSMHQIYCLFDFNPSLVHDWIRTNGNLTYALQMMFEVFGANKVLSPQVLQLFSQFPTPLHSAKFPGRELHIRSMAYMATSAVNYMKLKTTCLTRHYPPVVSELTYYLQVTSETFQRLLFITILCTLWSSQPVKILLPPDMQTTALRLFTQNQDNFFGQTLGFWNTPGHSFQQKLADIAREQTRWSVPYSHLLRSWVKSVRNNNAVRMPYVMTTPHTQQPTIPHQQALHPTASSVQTPNHFQHHTPWPRAIVRGNGRPNPQSIVPSQPIQGNQAQMPSRPPISLFDQVAEAQREPNPVRSSLHQAHLRSPTLRASSLQGRLRLYYYFESFGITPRRLEEANRKVEKVKISLDPELIKHVPAAVKGSPGACQVRLVDLASKTFYLRCIKWPVANTTLPNEHDWAAADTSWIPHSYFTLNGTSLQQRKKIHNGKDKAINITEVLQSDENWLEVSVLDLKQDGAFRDYLIAIESLGILDHDSILQNCREKQLKPAGQVKDDLKRRLNGDNGDDDELQITQSNLTIKLFDPFSAARMCAIPVRGKACLHSDCFDLETFLDTRQRNGDGSAYDQWRCPICSADARPQHLIVDGFMQQVKADLEARGMAHIREIIFRQDGSWEPKERTCGPSESNNTGPLSPTSGRRVESIYLSD